MKDVVPKSTASSSDTGDSHRSIRNVPIPTNRRQFTPIPNEHLHKESRGKRGMKGTFWLWAVAVVVACFAVGLIVSNFFAGATITVIPRQMSVTFPPALQAMLNAPSGVLSYQLMTTAVSASRTVPANGTTQVSTTAEGTMTVYNAYNTSQQKLVANTRFKAPDGKIYRIQNAIVVPGAKKNASGMLIPGSVQATVFADKPGTDYNISSMTRFTIPGFAGDPQRYSKFYGEASGISGGSTGMAPAVSSADMQTAQSAMKQEIVDKSSGAVSSNLPAGFASVAGTLSVQYGTISDVPADGGNALLTENATATVAIARTSDVAEAIARLQVQGYNGEDVNFTDPSKVSFALPSGTTYSSEATTIPLSVSGEAALSWQFDETKLKSALAGKDKSDFDTIVATFSPAVAKATASLRPFWKSSFPTDPARITIVISAGN